MQARLFTLILLLFSVHLSAEEKHLVILHTNDFHGHISQENNSAGAARIAALVKETRAQYPGVLVLDGGDKISGTPVSTMFEGVPIFEVLNEVGYDASVLGNHEFDHGYKQMLKFKEIAIYPLLAANAFAPDGSLLADAPSLITTVNGIKVGIIGLITEQTPSMIIPAGNEGISFAPAKEILQGMVAAIRPQVDLLILVSHVGHREEKVLAQEVQGIDVIIGGHSHTEVQEPIKVGNTYVAQAGDYGEFVGKIELTVDTNTNSMTSFKGKLIPAAELPPPDKDVDLLVKSWEKKVSDLVDFEIAMATRDYTQAELQPILQEILAQATGADFGYYNRGGIRDMIRQGPISARHIWNVEPFSNELVTITASGSIIKSLLQEEPSQSMRISTLEDDQIYTVASNSFVSAQLQKVAGDAVTIKNLNVLVRDILIDYVKENGFDN